MEEGYSLALADKKLMRKKEYQELKQQSKELFDEIAKTLDTDRMKLLMEYEDVMSQMAIIENVVYHDIGKKICSQNVAKQCLECKKSD